MTYTCDIFLAEYPEFAALAGAAERMLERADALISPRAWGKWRSMALGLWTAHRLALAHDVSAACKDLGKRAPYAVGSVSSQSASTGSLSVSYSVPSSGSGPFAAEYARSAYGLEFLSLIHSVIAPGAVILSPDASARVPDPLPFGRRG